MPETPPPPERPLLGMALRCAGATAFAIMSALLKHANNLGATIDDLIFYRSLGGLPIVVVWALWNDGPAGLRPNNRIKHFTRSLIGLVAMVLSFVALAKLPIADATTLTYSAPITATIVSALFLRESVEARRWLAVLIGFLGVLLVARPGAGQQLSAIGLAAGIGAAFGQAAVVITLRQIGKTERPGAIVFWFLLLTTLCSGVLLPWLGARHGPAMTALLLSGGLFGGFAQLAVTGSLRYAPVSTVVPFDYLQIIWAALIGWLVFASPPPATMLGGAVLIAASGLYIAHREHRRGREPLEGEAIPEA